MLSFSSLLEGYLPHTPDKDSHHHLLSVDRGMYVLLLVIAFDLLDVFILSLRRLCVNDSFVLLQEASTYFPIRTCFPSNAKPYCLNYSASNSNQNTSYPAAAATLWDAICDIPVP